MPAFEKKWGYRIMGNKKMTNRTRSGRTEYIFGPPTRDLVSNPLQSIPPNGSYKVAAPWP